MRVRKKRRNKLPCFNSKGMHHCASGRTRSWCDETDGGVDGGGGVGSGGGVDGGGVGGGIDGCN